MATTTTGSKPKPRRSKPGKARRKRSPQLPDVRTSERSSYNACRWQWFRSYVDHLTPHVDMPALRFGSLIHAALEKRYPPGIKRGPHPSKTFVKLYDDELEKVGQLGFRDADGEWADAKELGVAMLDAYVDLYGRDEEWKVVASEMTFRAPVFSPPALNGSGYVLLDGTTIVDEPVPIFNYVGTMDGVWENRMDGGIRVNDYKTTKGNPEQEAMGKFLLDEQATAYWTWGVDYLETEGILKPRQVERLDGMLYTFLRKAKPDPRPRNVEGQCLNKDGSVSQKQPPPMFHREIVYRDREQQEAARERAAWQGIEMHAVRTGRAPAYKVPGTSFPHQQCKGCAFFDICELHEIGADWETLRDSTMTTWNPYAAHEIAEEGKR